MELAVFHLLMCRILMWLLHFCKLVNLCHNHSEIRLTVCGWVIFCETRHHAKADVTYGALTHCTLSLATRWTETVAEFGGWFHWMLLVMAALELHNICCGHTWSSNQSRGGAILAFSSFKFRTRRSLKYWWVYFAPYEENLIQLLSTVRSRRWKKQFCGPLEGTLTQQVAVGHMIRIVGLPHVQMYCSKMWGFMRWWLPSQKFPSAGCGSMLACKLLICPSKLMWSNLPWSSPLRHPFSVSVVLVQSWGMSVLLGCAVPHEFILCLSKSSKSLGDEKKLSINILCPKPSTLQSECLTVAYVAVMSVAQCEPLPKYTLMS